jgi:hypothetical protein
VVVYVTTSILFACFTIIHVRGIVGTECGCFGALSRARGVQTSQVLTWFALSMMLVVSVEYGVWLAAIEVTIVGLVCALRSRKERFRDVPTVSQQLVETGVSGIG